MAASSLLGAVCLSLAPILFADSELLRDTPFVAGAVGALGLIGALALWAAGGVGAVGTAHASDGPDSELSLPERRLQVLMAVVAVLLAGGCLLAATLALIEMTDHTARRAPVVLLAAIAGLAAAITCTYISREPRRRLRLAGPLTAAAAMTTLAATVFAADQLLTQPRETVELLGGEPRLSLLLGAMAVAGGTLTVAIWGASRRAWISQHQSGYLWPVPFRALSAVAEVLIAGESQVAPKDVARRADAFLADFRPSRKWIYQLMLTVIWLAPLIEIRPVPRLNPPLSEMDPASRRRFLEANYRRLARHPRVRFLKVFKQLTIRICQQLTYAGYYGDERTFESVGYKPFSQRSRYADLDPPDPGPHPLKVEPGGSLPPADIEADICIVGSGAAGGILAYELARAGRSVVVLERGPYVEPREFTEDEIGMISRLYGDGLMQQSEDFRFTILQGSCVGGSTTVNNAVCFPPPDPVLARWNDPAGQNAGLDLDELRRATGDIEQFLSISPQDDVPLNPSGEDFVRGALRAAPDGLEVGAVRANITGCLGSGYCNIGCKWGRKLSMLDSALPWAQRDFPGRVRVISDCRVERIVRRVGSDPSVAGLQAKLPDGSKVAIKAGGYVLAAGAVASSHLLLKSGVGRGLPVGHGFSANMGTPLTAELNREVNAFDGLQISHYGLPSGNGFVFETWFNPPVAQALNMPGWFEDHFRNMSVYNRLMAVGVLVGTASNGRVRNRLGAPSIKFKPVTEDLRTLATGLKLLGRALFEAGATRVMANTWAGDEFTSVDQLERLDEICTDPSYITLGTGHPQGGNALSADHARGVVNPDFQVHGSSNMFVCDASVFPTSLTVNPQLTVMSLAKYAAPRIAELAPEGA